MYETQLYVCLYTSTKWGCVITCIHYTGFMRPMHATCINDRVPCIRKFMINDQTTYYRGYYFYSCLFLKFFPMTWYSQISDLSIQSTPFTHIVEMVWMNEWMNEWMSRPCNSHYSQSNSDYSQSHSDHSQSHSDYSQRYSDYSQSQSDYSQHHSRADKTKVTIMTVYTVKQTSSSLRRRGPYRNL